VTFFSGKEEGTVKKALFNRATLLVAVVAGIGLVFAAAAWAGGGKETTKPTLNIICFQGYAEDDWVKPFETQYNVTYIGTVDECFTKTKAAPDEYHIVSNDSGRVKLYYDAGLIQAIDTSKLKNYSKVGEFFREHPYAQVEPGKKFHVPMTWGTQTITINTAKVPPNMLKPFLSADGRTVSLDILTAPEAKGYTAFFDETTNVTDIAAIQVGAKDIFNFQAQDWDKVFNMLLKWKRNARTLTTGLDSEFNIMANEDALILLGGNDALINIKFQEDGIRNKFTQYPMTEGTICWIDGWVITKPTSGASLDLALKYIDYIIGDEGQSKMAELVGFGIVNTAGKSAYNPAALDACWWYGMDINQVPFPIHVMLAEEDPGRRVELWNRVKATP
jgi:spermidine/putrescine-binding protein